ncbi:MAG TPA: p-hydroxycinnamoyl CoA hydratase/lyase [Xanthobacteraceae bacterium]|jgi:trans-feruloyl-CoA hydratase/vanillin synthase|nr:p-hydroxycinnamoyl CoA hydratase/lyase [Xanthobacteraceae bacterium]
MEDLQPSKPANPTNIGDWKHVLVEIAEGIAWVTLNRPEKRNCMSPALNDEMVQVLDAIELEDAAGVLVLTGAGEAFSAGMDLKEYFRDVDALPYVRQVRARRSAWQWQWRMLMNYSKPTIAMVNGWCFGGAFMPLVACDLAVAAEEAQFGLSEINWGIIPGGNVTRAVVATMNLRDAMYYVMTGRTFDGRKAAEMGLVNEACPRTELRARTRALALELVGKNPTVLRAAKAAVRHVQGMSWEMSEEYLMAKSAQARFLDPEQGRAKGLKQFLDDKSFRPGLGGYDRDG